jgi:hypothetical protein
MSWSNSVVGKPEAVAKQIEEYANKPDSLTPDSPEKQLKTAALEFVKTVAKLSAEGNQALLQVELSGHAWEKNQQFNISIKTIGNYAE